MQAFTFIIADTAINPFHRRCEVEIYIYNHNHPQIMNYPEKVIEALREFYNGETYQYNVKILSPLELIEKRGRNLTTSDNGLIAGWQITKIGLQVLRDNPDKH